MNKTFDNPAHRRHRYIRKFWSSAIVLVVFSFAPAAYSASDQASTPDSTVLDLSPLVYWQRNSETASVRLKALGPLIEFGGDEKLSALPRPLFVAFSTPRSSGFDLAWPFVAARYRQDGKYIRVFNYLQTRKPQDDTVRRSRDWLLPLLFTGTDNKGEPYAAVFPVIGSIHNIIGVDNLSFVLFPLYLQANRGHTESHSILWPVFNRTTAKSWQKWRVFPFYGVRESHNADQRHYFLLWPMIHWSSWTTENRSGNAWFAFPLLGRSQDRSLDTRSNSHRPETMAQSTTVLWPFFLFSSTPQSRNVHAPWPFVQVSRSEFNGHERRKLFLWPAWGRTVQGEKWYRFIAWPLFHQWNDTHGSEIVQRTWLVPFYRHQRHFSGNKRTSTELQIWPLFSMETREQTFDLKALRLWPMAQNPIIDRIFAPLYTVFEYHRADNESLRWSLLWNTLRWESDQQNKQLTVPLLFDWQNSPTTTNFSLLKGLFGIQRGEKNSIKLLYFLKF